MGAEHFLEGQSLEDEEDKSLIFSGGGKCRRSLGLFVELNLP